MPVTNNERVKWFTALIIMTGASGAGGTFFGAPDRFTGSDGAVLEAQLKECQIKLIQHLATPHPPIEIDRTIHQTKDALEDHINTHRWPHLEKEQ